jgi:hypothetical protein
VAAEKGDELMGLTQKDFEAGVLTGLAVLVFAATHESWNVWLVGASHRCAAGAITLLGVLACALGSPGKDLATRVLAVLGIAAGALAVLALVTASLTPLSLLTLAIVLLWAAALWRHAHVAAHA